MADNATHIPKLLLCSVFRVWWGVSEDRPSMLLAGGGSLQADPWLLLWLITALLPHMAPAQVDPVNMRAWERGENKFRNPTFVQHKRLMMVMENERTEQSL